MRNIAARHSELMDRLPEERRYDMSNELRRAAGMRGEIRP